MHHNACIPFFCLPPILDASLGLSLIPIPQVMERHPPDAALDDVQLDSKTATVLYTEGDLVHVMDSESYEQAAVSAGLFGDQKPFVVPDSEVTLRVWDGEVVRAQVSGRAGGLIYFTAKRYSWKADGSCGTE